MAKKIIGGKSVAVGAGIRTASEQLIKQLESSGVSAQVIGQLRALLRQLPGGSILKNAIRVWANKLDEKVLAAIEPWLEELFRDESEETDMPPKGKQGQKKGGGGNPVDKALTMIDALDDARRRKLKAWLDSYSPGVKNIILEKFSSRNAQSLKAFVQDLMVKEEGGKKVDLLVELNLTGSAELDAITLSGTSEAVEKAMEVRDWLLKKSPQTFDAVMEVKTNMAYDSKGDNPAFIAWLASFHSLGEDAAVKQLERLVKGKSSNDIAQMADVRPNYPTLLMQLPGKVWNFFRRTAPKEDAFQSYLEVVNADLRAQGLTPIAMPENLK